MWLSGQIRPPLKKYLAALQIIARSAYRGRSAPPRSQ